MQSIVQFFHPGGEHGFDKNRSKDGCLFKDWNNIKHQRKFLLNEGSYIKNEKKHEGKLLFWGEWEPPSKVTELKQQSNSSQYGINPKYLHCPFLPSVDEIKKYQETWIYHKEHRQEVHYYQNSDPFVFGNNFIYGICLQKMQSLRTLEPGSLIIFGSYVNCRFAIDTVFVVKTAEKYASLEDVEKIKIEKYPDIVTKFIMDKNNKVSPPNGLILYTGATFNDPVKGMYSFVPAKVFNGEEIGFPRFLMPDEFYKSKNNRINKYFSEYSIEGDKIIERKNQGIKRASADIGEISTLWEYIKTEVSKDYVLGYNFKMPDINNNFHWKKESFHPPVNPKKGSCVGSHC
ncbi:MAG: hypothetical protein LBI28_05645 [Treponema sp.]|jgi:hypothetical protein|nr:hypothetical protein [Treponema sp.]